MARTSWLIPLCLASAACDNTGLYRGSDPPKDAGFEIPDAGFADGGFNDDATVDAGEPPPADEPVYIHTGDTLYSYDPETNTTQTIGIFSDANGPLDLDMVDIAIDLNGRMFGGTNNPANMNGPNEIYQIDPETAFCTRRFTFNDVLNGMTFLPNGPLVVAGRRISVVDPSDGHMVREFQDADMYETSGDIVGLPDGNLYWTVRGVRVMGAPPPSDRVVRINPTNGTLAVIGDAQIDRIYGLGYADGALYGFSSAGLVVKLNPSSGVVIEQQALTGRWFGATTNPVLW